MPKVLVIRFSSIGDIVLTSPVLRCVQQQLDAELHFLTKKSFRGLLQANPYVSKIYSIENKVSEVLPQLKKENYDYVIDLHKNWRSGQVKRGLKARSFDFDKINLEKWLMVNFKINRLPNLHIVDRYMAGLKKLGIRYDGAGLDYFIPPSELINLASFFEKNQLPGWEKGYLAFAIGAAHATKRLPADKIIEICKKLGRSVVLLGGPGDAPVGKKVAEACGPLVLNTCGLLSLHQSASLVEQAAQVISHDTGMMHIAAAFKKPIISVWGNTIPEFGMFPFYPQEMDYNTCIEVAPLSCRPCSKIGSKQCPKGHFKCMQQIDVKAILGAIGGK